MSVKNQVSLQPLNFKTNLNLTGPHKSEFSVLNWVYKTRSGVKLKSWMALLL